MNHKEFELCYGNDKPYDVLTKDNQEFIGVRHGEVYKIFKYTTDEVIEVDSIYSHNPSLDKGYSDTLENANRWIATHIK